MLFVPEKHEQSYLDQKCGECGGQRGHETGESYTALALGSTWGLVPFMPEGSGWFMQHKK